MNLIRSVAADCLYDFRKSLLSCFFLNVRNHFVKIPNLKRVYDIFYAFKIALCAENSLSHVKNQ